MVSANMHEAETRASEIVIAAEKGEELIICRNAKPVVRLVSIPTDPPLRDLIPEPHL